MSTTSPYDEFADDSGYSEDKVYARAGRDSEPVRVGEYGQVRIRSEIVYAIDAFIQSRVVSEYHTRHDFIRDAIIHHLHRRREQFKDAGVTKIDVFLRLAEAQRMTAVDQAERDLLRERESLLCNTRDPELLARFVKECKNDLPTIASAFNRNEMVRLIERYDREH